jgi:hypothetical protein
MVRKILFATLLAATLSAGAISARQLGAGANAPLACGSSCTRLDFCKNPCFCFGLFEGNTHGICQPEGPAPLRPR